MTLAALIRGTPKAPPVGAATAIPATAAEAGGIQPKTLRAYTQSFAEGIRSGRIVVREGAESASGSIVTPDAELEAARKGRIVVKV